MGRLPTAAPHGTNERRRDPAGQVQDREKNGRRDAAQRDVSKRDVSKQARELSKRLRDLVDKAPSKLENGDALTFADWIRVCLGCAEIGPGTHKAEAIRSRIPRMDWSGSGDFPVTSVPPRRDLLRIVQDLYDDEKGKTRSRGTKVKVGVVLSRANALRCGLGLDIDWVARKAGALRLSPEVLAEGPRRPPALIFQEPSWSLLEGWRFSFPHMDLEDPQPSLVGAGVRELADPRADAANDDSGPHSASDADEGRRENNVRELGEREWAWTPDSLRRTCDHSTREAIFEHVPEAEQDEILFRYCAFVLWTTFYDEHTNQCVLPNDALLWMAQGEYDTGLRVIEHLRQYLDLDYEQHIPKRRCRLLRKDGLPHELYKAVSEDLSTPATEQGNRVYILSGRPYTATRVTRKRKDIREDLKDERHRAPSPGAQKTFELLNFGVGEGLRPSRSTACITDHIEEAYKYVRRMDVDAELSTEPFEVDNEEEEDRDVEEGGKDDEGGEDNEGGGDDESKDVDWAAYRAARRQAIKKQRRQYFLALRAIEDQHQQFYGFSEAGRTDRGFSYNRGPANLPSEVRAILYQGFYDVDLVSAHLLVAAWLWDAERSLELLTDEDYVFWDDLMEQVAPLFEEAGYEVPVKGEELYATVKATAKVAVYSAVYGMHRASVQGEVTKSLQDVLGPDVGEYVRSHPIIEELLRKRDEKLAEIEPGDVLRGPTGIEIEVEVSLDRETDEDCDQVGPRSAMATLAQSYEQAAMQVILEMEAERETSTSRNRFKVGLWLHDGAYVKMRSKQARMKELNRRLQKRCKELAAFAGKNAPLPAFFEIEEVDPPPLPPRQTEAPKQTEDQNKCRARAARPLRRPANGRQKARIRRPAPPRRLRRVRRAGQATSGRRPARMGLPSLRPTSLRHTRHLSWRPPGSSRPPSKGLNRWPSPCFWRNGAASTRARCLRASARRSGGASASATGWSPTATMGTTVPPLAAPTLTAAGALRPGESGALPALLAAATALLLGTERLAAASAPGRGLLVPTVPRPD